MVRRLQTLHLIKAAKVRASFELKSYTQTHLSQPALQTSFTKFDRDHPKQKLITQKVAAMVCKDLQPFTVVDDPGFRAVLKASEPCYTLQARKTFSEDIIPKLYDETKLLSSAMSRMLSVWL